MLPITEPQGSILARALFVKHKQQIFQTTNISSCPQMLIVMTFKAEGTTQLWLLYQYNFWNPIIIPRPIPEITRENLMQPMEQSQSWRPTYAQHRKGAKVKVLVVQSCLTLRVHGLWPTRFLCPWDSLGKNTGVDSHSLLQGIFPTSSLGLLHRRQILYHPSHWGSPQIMHMMILI